jgi:hypothetical protein
VCKRVLKTCLFTLFGTGFTGLLNSILGIGTDFFLSKSFDGTGLSIDQTLLLMFNEEKTLIPPYVNREWLPQRQQGRPRGGRERPQAILRQRQEVAQRRKRPNQENLQRQQRQQPQTKLGGARASAASVGAAGERLGGGGGQQRLRHSGGRLKERFSSASAQTDGSKTKTMQKKISDLVLTVVFPFILSSSTFTSSFCVRPETPVLKQNKPRSPCSYYEKNLYINPHSLPTERKPLNVSIILNAK